MSPPRPPRPSAQLTRQEPGSFRDPESRVFYAAGEVYRALSRAGLDDFEALEASGLLADPRIVRTERAGAESLASDVLPDGVAAILRHELIPFVSYPYEWTFSMLKDAALLQLDLLLAALAHGLIFKDASPYNVQFNGSRAVFIDVGSFERVRPGEAWNGYRQFCMLYLYPLLLQARKDADFHSWLRGGIDGIAPAQMRAISSFGDRFRRGFPTHVYLHARLERRYRGRAAEVKREVRRAGIGKELIVANVRKMRKLVSRLDWSPPRGVWVAYGEHNSYTEDDARRKDAFVRNVARSQAWELAWDLGANNGRHSRIAAEGARRVVAIDADQGPVELLYRELREAGDERVLPLTMNLADPSPALGWRGLERKTLPERGRPDLVIALAFVHHMAIAANVPVREIVDWLAGLGGALIVEFPTREDPMVQTLLAPKRDGLHADYQREHFEQCLGDAFDVHRREQLASGTRILYFATPKSP